MKKKRMRWVCNSCLVTKILRIMKLSVFLFFLSFVQVLANGTYAQKTKLSVDLKNTSIESVLLDIESQSNFKFIYNKGKVDVDSRVDIQLREKSINETLDVLFEARNVNYTFFGNNIVLTKSDSEATSGQQKKSVTGKITDSSGSTLPGVSVVILGTTNGTITDSKGIYSLSNVPENAILQFSFIGMKKQEVTVGSKTTINVSLAEETIGVDEVVVVGYGTQKKVNLTGSVDVVTSEALVNRSAANVSLLLQGTSPNLNISITNEGGKPGSSPNFNIRGIGSINGNDSPLILIDGVESDINSIDPETIESVSILKDASASAIYGSRAPFGVVLITTKRGKINQPVQIQFNNNISFGSPIGVPHFVDALTWVTAYNQISDNAGIAHIYPDEQVERVRGYIAGTYKTEYDPAKPPYSIFRGRWMGNANNDWPDLYFKKNALSEKHNINVEGGNEKTQFFISAGYFNQGSLYSWGNDGYKRYNVMANVSTKVADWLRFDYSSKYSKSETNMPLGILGQPNTYIYRSMLSFSPMTPMYNIDGSIGNPLVRALQSNGRELTVRNDFQINLGTEIEPIKGWKTNISYNYNDGGSTYTENPHPVPVQVPNGTLGNVGSALSGYIENLNTSDYTLFNLRTSYEKTIGDHFFMAMIGYEQETSFYRGLFGSKMELITETVPSISTALGTATVGDEMGHWSTQGVFGRLNYNYKEKYLVEFSARQNGSSRFAKGSRWGFFPSFSAGYNIAKENFWTPIEPYVNTLKIRGSYGSLGNQNVNNYLYLSSIPVNTELNHIIGDERPIYAGIPGIISSNLTWETITTTDVGLDAGFLKNRLTMTSDWYNRVTSKMFGPAEDLPAVLGTSVPFSNNAKLSTKGWELTLAWNDRISSDLSYNLKVAIGDSKSTILKYKNDVKAINNWNEGRQIGEIWGFTSDGLIQTEGEKMPDQSKYYGTWGPGDMKYKDLDGNDTINDGSRTLDDHGDLSVIGNLSPRYNIGITAGINWKGVDVSMFWQGIGKRDYLPGENSNVFFGIVPNGSPGSESGLYKNGPGLDYWRPANDATILGPNTNAYFAKDYMSTENAKNRLPQSRYVLSAAYLRLKNFQIGYTVPQQLTKKIFINKARIYFSGENLLTFTKLPKVLDPETAPASDPSIGGREVTGGVYPISRNLSFGINLTF